MAMTSKILRDYIKDETVDLVYLDPPFNSAQDYNVLFKEQSEERAGVHAARPHGAPTA
jgi:16S rRNA G966 N2-methylase RsmD